MRNKPFIRPESLGFPPFNAPNLFNLLLMPPEISHLKAPPLSEASGFLFPCTRPDLAAHVSLVARTTSKSQIPADSPCLETPPAARLYLAALVRYQLLQQKRGKKVIGLM